MAGLSSEEFMAMSPEEYHAHVAKLRRQQAVGEIHRGNAEVAKQVEARGTEFQMRPNMKARPGSQGTLFQGGKPTDEHRWVRGYSPTRMAQMVDRLGGGGIYSRINFDIDPEHRDIESHPYWNPHSYDHTRRLITEPIARSTVSPSDVSHLDSLTFTNQHWGPKLGEHQSYGPDDRSAINRRRIVLYPNPTVMFGEGRMAHRRALAESDSVLIHEMGHQTDSLHNPGYLSEKRGVSEGVADRKMIETFRNDPRNQRRTQFDVRKMTYGGRGAAAAAGEGYKDPGADRSHKINSLINSEQFRNLGNHQGELF